ncbi:MAG TPA: hypothetical protein DCL54_19555, partial [Alphaproteobacteria bacterium]|nr:hypothetical protein [Alphaproteobacteria bacterium]
MTGGHFGPVFSLPTRPHVRGARATTRETAMRQSRFDIHQHITAAILKAIDAGPGDFHLPWHRSAGAIMRPRNALTEKSYQGVNILGLWAQADVAGFSAGLWATFKQWH